MARKTDLDKLRIKSSQDVDTLTERFKEFEETLPSEKYLLRRWAAEMSIVELHAIWERFAEERLVIALNHKPAYFIEENSVKGTDIISKGLAHVLVKGNQSYFDFRSMDDLIKKGNKLLGNTNNPFLSLPKNPDRNYLDTLSAIRNYIVHRSQTSQKSYKKALKDSFNISSSPEPSEFLNAKDSRTNSPKKWDKRIFVIAKVVKDTINRV